MAGTSPAMTTFGEASALPERSSFRMRLGMTIAGLFHKRARRLQVQRIGVDLVAGARIDLGHDRIVPGDDAVGMASETRHDVPPLEHVAEIVENRKRALAMHVGVIMRSIRR